MMDDPYGMLIVARTIRNPVLFNHSLILAINPWSEPYYLKPDDEDPLKKIAENAYAKACMKVVAAERQLTEHSMAKMRILPLPLVMLWLD